MVGDKTRMQGLIRILPLSLVSAASTLGKGTEAQQLLGSMAQILRL